MKKRIGSEHFLGPMLLGDFVCKKEDPLHMLKQPDQAMISYRAATDEEQERALRFRKMLADLSPDMYRAYLTRAGSAPGLSITDAEIDSRLGPILRRHGFDPAEIETRRKRRTRAVTDRNRGEEGAKALTVVEVDFTTDDYLQNFRLMLEMILQGRRMNRGWNPYCIPIMSRALSVGTACIAPLNDWRKTAGDSDEIRLSGHIERAYRGLAKAASISTDFDRCEIVRFERGEDDSATRWAQRVNQAARPNASTRNSETGDPLILVEGDVVVAALPRDNGNRVVAATVAVEGIGGPLSTANSEFLPEIGELIAYAMTDKQHRQYAS